MNQLQQQAKIRWAGEGDANTGYYHAVIGQRRQQNTITHLQTEEGEHITDEADIKQHILCFYKQLLGTKRARESIKSVVVARGPKMTRMEGETLTAPVSNEEIKAALWSIRVCKAPGPDDFNSGFSGLLGILSLTCNCGHSGFL